MTHGTFRDYREPAPSLEELNRRAAARMAEIRREDEERQREYDAGFARVRAIGQALFDQQKAARWAERDALEAERQKQAAAMVTAARRRAEAALRRVGTLEPDVARLAQAKERSTTQRRGSRTKPRLASGSRTTSSRMPCPAAASARSPV